MPTQCTCLICGVRFMRSPSRVRPKNYCSAACRLTGLHDGNRRHPSAPGVLHTCTACGLAQPSFEFRRRLSRTDSFCSTCRKCRRALSAAYQSKNRAGLAAKAKARYWTSPERFRRMAAAHQAVRAAIKAGALHRPAACENCGKNGQPQAAHHDYTRPLFVRWLCQSCHTIWDKADPKSRHL